MEWWGGAAGQRSSGVEQWVGVALQLWEAAAGAARAVDSAV